MSYRRMTKEERKKHIRSKYFSVRHKVYVFAVFLVIMLLLVYAFLLSLNQNIDPILPVIIFLAIVVAFVIGLFFVDMVFWESE